MIDSLILKLNLVEANVEFLKQLNIEINHKLNFEQRIKAGNIIAKTILTSFYDKLDKIEFNKIKFYSDEEIDEKNKQSNKIIETQEFIKNNFNIYISLEKICQIKFLYSLDNDRDIKECIILTLFFIIRNNLDQEFNDSMNNNAIKLNEQIEDSLQKMKKKSNNEKLSENMNKSKNGKVSETNNLGFITINLADQPDKKCQKFYESINLIKKYYKVNKNSTFEGSIKTAEIFYSKFNEKIIDSSLDSFKEYLNNISKFNELRGNIPSEYAIDLYFKNEKEDILSDVQIFRQIKQLSREFDNLKSQKEEGEDTIKYLKEIGLNLDKNISVIKMLKSEVYEYIEKYIEYFNIQKKMMNSQEFGMI